ncbi:MAG TPA: hypothetical protein VE957_20930 [Terriglobales bacterium]|nr:hypothetical protein [Terriglobales bacterium]
MNHLAGMKTGWSAEGAPENATVVRELLEDSARRGPDFSIPRLYVLDGALETLYDISHVAAVIIAVS